MNINRFCGGPVEMGTRDTFVVDGWRYATDCRICVRVQTKARNSPATRVRAKAARLDWSASRAQWHPMPTAEDINLLPPYPAYGSIPDAVRLGRCRFFRRCYLRMLAALPDCEWQDSTQWNKAMRLRFAGGEALLIPVEVVLAVEMDK